MASVGATEAGVVVAGAPPEVAVAVAVGAAVGADSLGASLPKTLSSPAAL